MENLEIAFSTALVIISLLALLIGGLVIKLVNLQEDKRELKSEIRSLQNKEYRSKFYKQ